MSGPQFTNDTWRIAANDRIAVSRKGTFVFCQNSTLPFKIQFDHNPPTNFDEGVKVNFAASGTDFEHLWIINENSSEIAVTLSIGNGDVTDDAKVIKGDINAKIVAADAFTADAPVTVASGTVQQIAPENLLRRELIVKNIGLDGRVWLRPDAVSAVGGLPLEAGEGTVITTTAAAYIYNQASQAVEIAFTQVEVTS